MSSSDHAQRAPMLTRMAAVLGGYPVDKPGPEQAAIPRWVAASLLAVALFYPALLPTAVPLRAVAIALGVLGVCVELHLSTAPSRVRVQRMVGVAAASTLVLVVIEIAARLVGDRLLAVNAEHLFLLAPLFGGLGWLLVRNRGHHAYRAAYLAVAGLTALAAVFEFLAGYSLFGRDEQFLTSQREGAVRVLLASEHVLILGVLFAVGVTLAASVRHWPTRVLLTVLLLIGCLTTGSRGPAALAGLVAVIQALPFVVRIVQRHTAVALAAAAVAVAALGWASVMVWTADIPGATGGAYSTNYRWASYSLLPDILAERPMGYLLLSPPHGVWMMSSELRGPVDLVDSADSELIFAALGLGWLGIAFYLGALALSIRTLRHSAELGFPTLLMTGLGLLMALHGWDGMSNLWYLLLGCSAAVVINAEWKREPRV